MILKGANNWNDGFRSALEHGHMEIVNMMIDKGADDFNYGLELACLQCNKDLMLFMLRKGAKIDMRRHSLDKDDIYWLIQNGITEFGGYKKVVQDCKDLQHFTNKKFRSL